MNRRTLSILLTAVLSISSSSFALQQTQPAAPDVPSSAPTTNGSVQALKVTVTAVEGIVQVRTGSDQPWQRAIVGMELNQDAEFRTAPRSAVQFKIPPDQTITLDRLGTVKVLEAIDDNGKLKTKLGMKYGRTRYDIESAGQEHEASIASPSSTLAIRGTKVSLYDQRPFVSVATSLTGRAEFRDARKTIAFGNKGAGTTKVDTQTGNSAQYALDKSIVDPSIARARTASEAGLIAAVFSTGATVDYDFQKGIRVVTGGRPLTDTQLLPVLPDALDFVLRWTGAGTDLNLGVISPGTTGNRLVYPVGGLNILPNGGSIAYDDRGGPHGGMEIASFPKNFPEGLYRVGSVLVSGPNSPATLEVFLNGKLVPFTSSQEDGKTVTTANYTAMPINPAIATGQAVGLVPLEPSQGVIGAQPTPSATHISATRKK